MQVYNIDDSIQEFFSSSTSVSREECDAYVRDHYAGSAHPVPLQGCFSYTLAVGDKIVQFRRENSKLDESNMQLVRQAADGFLPDTQYHGTIGEDRPLHIYEMIRLPGEMYIFARDASIPQPENAKAQQINIVKDLARLDAPFICDVLTWSANTYPGGARFFAQCWNNGHILPPHEITLLVAEYSYNLGRLRESLPERFAGVLDSITAHKLSTAFSKLPVTVTHEDLCELNFLIDPDTGHITGIIDWAEARILPFGLGLWALEKVLGFMDSEGWHYYDNHEELRSLFWNTFRVLAKEFADQNMELVVLTRLVGLFRRHAFRTDGTKVLGVVTDEDVSALRYLDVFCLDK